MCSICYQIPCLPGCPNEDEPVAVLLCKGCGEGICVGDSYQHIGAHDYCLDCVEDMSGARLLELLGITPMSAEAYAPEGDMEWMR